MTPDARDADQQAATKELQHHIKAVVGINTRITVVDGGAIPRSEGKAKRVFDKRKDN
jgi:phenylacetate-CoA ligase